MDAGRGHHDRGPPARDTALRWLRRGGAVILTVLLVECFVLPRIVSARTDMSLLSSADPALLLLALGLEICSPVSNGALTRPSCVRGAGRDSRSS